MTSYLRNFSAFMKSSLCARLVCQTDCWSFTPPFYTLGYQRATMISSRSQSLSRSKTFGDNWIRASMLYFPSCAQKECNIATIMSISCLPLSSRWAFFSLYSPMKRVASRLDAGRRRRYLWSNCCYLLLYGVSTRGSPFFVHVIV